MSAVGKVARFGSNFSFRSYYSKRAAYPAHSQSASRSSRSVPAKNYIAVTTVYRVMRGDWTDLLLSDHSMDELEVVSGVSSALSEGRTLKHGGTFQGFFSEDPVLRYKQKALGQHPALSQYPALGQHPTLSQHLGQHPALSQHLGRHLGQHLGQHPVLRLYLGFT